MTVGTLWWAAGTAFEVLLFALPIALGAVLLTLVDPPGVLWYSAGIISYLIAEELVENRRWSA